MEKIITIDGRQVPFRSTGALLLRYKAQFQRDALKDIVKLYPLIQKCKELKDAEDPEAALNILDGLDMQTLYNFVWVMAKAADPAIPHLDAWLDGFGTFPIMDIISELSELLHLSIKVSKKN